MARPKKLPDTVTIDKTESGKYVVRVRGSVMAAHTDRAAAEDYVYDVLGFERPAPSPTTAGVAPPPPPKQDESK